MIDAFDVWKLGIILLVLLIVGLYLAMTAGRLDRLHVRHDAAVASLELQFALRAEAVAETIAEGAIDPVSAGLLARALAARRTDGPMQVAAEGELSALLREVVEAHDGAVASGEVQQTLRSACNRVAFAHGFLDEAVDATLEMRHRPIIKYLGLAGHTAYPRHIPCDVDVPQFAD